MKTLNILFAIVAASLFFVGCDDYLDVEPKGLQIPNSVQDYDLLLNGGSFTIHTTANEQTLFLSSDDWYMTGSDVGDINAFNNELRDIYTYADGLFQNQDISSGAWNAPYKNIYHYNLILNEIDDAVLTGAYTDEDKKAIKAEALVGRAYEYWILVNTFANAYDSATASSDLGVPIVVTADASAQTGARNTVQEVYNQIISDMEAAIDDMPESQTSDTRITKGGAEALLARFYLSMSDYANAKAWAEKALGQNNHIGDYLYSDHIAEYAKEQYFNRFYQYTRGFYQGYISQDLVSLFDEDNDMRLQTLFVGCEWVFDPVLGWQYVCSGQYRNTLYMEVNHSPSVPEMHLIIAEAEARSGNKAAALAQLDMIAANRIIGYTNYNLADFATDNDVMQEVINERRRELAIQGFRLFDLKRYNLESAFAKPTKHNLAGDEFQVEAGSPKLVLPIPGQVLARNPNMQQNPR